MRSARFALSIRVKKHSEWRACLAKSHCVSIGKCKGLAFKYETIAIGKETFFSYDEIKLT